MEMDIWQRFAALLGDTLGGLFRALFYVLTGRDLAAEAAERVAEQARQEAAAAASAEAEAECTDARAARETTVALGEEQLAVLLEVKRLLKDAAPRSVATERRERHAAIKAAGEIVIRSGAYDVDEPEHADKLDLRVA